MPDEDILKQFQEFLEAKAANEKEEAAAEDFDVEIWDEKGRGVRTKRSHAKPFLQQLGLDPDDPPSSDDGNSDSGDAGKPDNKGSGKGKAPTRNATGPTSTARKYFASKAKP